METYVAYDKNHANQEANDGGFQNAISENNAFNHKNANQIAKGAVFFGRRQLQYDSECSGNCGDGYAGIPPSGFNNAKQTVDAANGANYFNQANQGRNSNAHKHANAKRIVQHNINQESFADANANSNAVANALSKGGFFSQKQAGQVRGVTQNNGLFYRQ